MPEPIFAPDALRQLRKLRVRDQRGITDGIVRHVVHAPPAEQSRNKFPLRQMSHWVDYELRLGKLRVFYRVDEEDGVTITVIGVKEGNRLRVEGEEFPL